MSDEFAQDEEIREMNERLAAHEGFVAEKKFDEREADYDASEEAAEKAEGNA